MPPGGPRVQILSGGRGKEEEGKWVRMTQERTLMHYCWQWGELPTSRGHARALTLTMMPVSRHTPFPQ